MSIRMINPGAGNLPNPVGNGARVNPPTVTIMTDAEVIAEIEARKQILFVTALPATGDTTHIWCLNNDELWLYSSANEWRRVNDRTHRINGAVAATYSVNDTFAYTMPVNTYVRVNDFVVFNNLFCIVAARTGGAYATGFACTLRVLATDLSYTALYRVVADMNPVVKVFQSTSVPVPSTNPPKARVGDLLLIGAPNAEALAIITAMTATTYTVTILADNVTHCVLYVPNKAALPTVGDTDFLYITLDTHKAWYWDTSVTPNKWQPLAASAVKVVTALTDVPAAERDGETLYVVKRKTTAPVAASEAYWWDPVAGVFNPVYDLPVDIVSQLFFSAAALSEDQGGVVTIPMFDIVRYNRATATAVDDPEAIKFKAGEDMVIERDATNKIIGFRQPFYVKFVDNKPDPDAPLPKDRPKQNVIYLDGMHRLWRWDNIGQEYEAINGKVMSVENIFPNENGNVDLGLNNKQSVSDANFEDSLRAHWDSAERQQNDFRVPSFPAPIPLNISPAIVDDFKIIWYGKSPDSRAFTLTYYVAGSTSPDKPSNAPSLWMEERDTTGAIVNRTCFGEGGMWVENTYSPAPFTSDNGGDTHYGANDPAEVDEFIDSITTLGTIKYSYQYMVDLGKLEQTVNEHIADNERHLTEEERERLSQGLVTSVEHIPPDATGNVDLGLDNTGELQPAVPGAIWACTYDSDYKKHVFVVTGVGQAYTPPSENSTIFFVLSDDGEQRGELRFLINGKVEWVKLNAGVQVYQQTIAENGFWLDETVTFFGRYDSWSGDNTWMQMLPETEFGYQWAAVYSIADIADGLAAEIARATAAEAALADKDDDLQTQIWSLQNLGRFLGSVPTYADIASFVLPSGAGLRDFITVQHDETNAGLSSRYILTDLGPPPVWTFDLTYQTDITGKVDKLVSNWTPGHLVRSVNDGSGNGNIEDAGFSLEQILQDLDTAIAMSGSYMGTYNDMAALHAALDTTGERLAKGKSWALIKQNANLRPALMSVRNQNQGVSVTWNEDYEWVTAGIPWPNYSARTTLISTGNTDNPLEYTVTEPGWYQVNVEDTSNIITHLRVWVNDINVYGEYDENNGYDNIYSTLLPLWPGDRLYARTYALNSTSVVETYKRLYKFGTR